MEPITWEQAHENIRALDVPPIIREVFEGRGVLDVLQWDFCQPFELLDPDMPPSFDNYPPGRITPVWADHTGSGIVGYRHDGGPPGFLRFGLESAPGEPAWIEGLSYPQVIVHELARLWEAETSDDQLREAARLLEFPAIDALLRSLATARRDTAEAYDAWEREFMATLPSHPAGR